MLLSKPKKDYKSVSKTELLKEPLEDVDQEDNPGEAAVNIYDERQEVCEKVRFRVKSIVWDSKHTVFFVKDIIIGNEWICSRIYILFKQASKTGQVSNQWINENKWNNVNFYKRK